MINYNVRFKEFAKDNLPHPNWDTKRDVSEYIYFEEGKANVSSNLMYSLEHITWASMYYPYTCGHITGKKVNGKYVSEYVVGHCHTHDFEGVVRDLYYSPQTFKISKKEEEFYSKQELKYLKDIQGYLLFLGLEDVKKYPISVKRYRNKKQAKYANASKHNYNSELIKTLIDGKRDYIAIKWYKGCRKESKVYKPQEYQALVRDENGKYRMFIEFTYDEIKKYKDIKEECPVAEFKDNDKVILLHLKILEVF